MYALDICFTVFQAQVVIKSFTITQRMTLTGYLTLAGL